MCICFEYHNMNSMHFHCIKVEAEILETDILKPEGKNKHGETQVEIL